ncbi:NAD(P)-dependent oxidoreductase [Pseudactinotalea suaedae]|uniref:NAD(P)-dependent oxidoreductase n=1 Tax=Pseudactinotalea suaedae TaxID=1524924 RepID=UPI0012E31FBB|nr:NAD(P)-dependent oxidoreductase [Pseudactinotalea suaedae]
MSQVLVCLSDYPRELLASWVEGADVEVVTVPSGADLAAMLPDLARADVVIGDAARRFPLEASVLAQLQRCRLVFHPAVGLDGVIDLEAARAHGIEVRSAPGYNADAVADWTVMAMLLGLRGAVAADRDIRAQGWHRRLLGRELGAVTVGIVGYGAIGRGVRRRLAGFGSTVLVTDEREVTDPDVEQTSLDDLLQRADVVTLHAPLLPSTRQMVSGERLARMREGSVLVNAARGGLVDETALATALTHGRPAVAVLDVFETEPLPPSSPLLGLENVVLSPHVAAGTEQARQRVRALVGDAVREFFRSGP